MSHSVILTVTFPHLRGRSVSSFLTFSCCPFVPHTRHTDLSSFIPNLFSFMTIATLRFVAVVSITPGKPSRRSSWKSRGPISTDPYPSSSWLPMNCPLIPSSRLPWEAIAPPIVPCLMTAPMSSLSVLPTPSAPGFLLCSVWPRAGTPWGPRPACRARPGYRWPPPCQRT